MRRARWLSCSQNNVLNTIHYVAVLIFIIDQLLMFVVMGTPAPLRWLFYSCFAVSFLAFRRCYCLEQQAGFDWEGTSDGATRKVCYRSLCTRGRAAGLQPRRPRVRNGRALTWGSFQVQMQRLPAALRQQIMLAYLTLMVSEYLLFIIAAVTVDASFE